MRSVILTMAILVTISASPVDARSGHGHRDRDRHAKAGSSTPADQKNTDARPPEKRDPEDTKIDKRIKSICQGC